MLRPWVMKHGSIIRGVSFDPGNNLGRCAFEVDLHTTKITILDASTVDLNQVAEKFWEELIDEVGIKLARLIALKATVRDYCRFWCPTIGLHETAFSAHGRQFGGSIESFATLRENILAIKLGFLEAEMSVQPVAINPNSVKMAVPGVKSKDKEQIKIGLRGKANLDLSKANLDSLDEHGIDSIAIAYTFCHKIVFGEHNEQPKRSKRPRRNKNKSIG